MKYYLRCQLCIGLLCVLVLSLALIIEKFYNVPACILCLYSRLIIFIVIVNTMIFIGKAKIYWLYSSILLFFVGIILSLTHILVEKKIIVLNIACKGRVGKNPTDLLMQINQNSVVVPCDEVTFDIFGFSLAQISLVFYLLVFLFLVYLKRHYTQNND